MLADKFDSTIEAKWQHFWAAQETYRFDEDDNKRPIYSIDTPPPFTSGDLHMGHVLSYAYFDFVARYKRMNGFNVYFPQGWDCQGFPTEVKVEAKHGKKEPEEFRKLCVAWTEEYIKKMKGQMDSLGFSPDWRYEYRTMYPDYHKRVQYSLLKMHEMGLVYRAEHPVFWCTHCRSALAKTDTEELEKQTTLHYINFTCKGQKLVVATTRPEYLHACVAVLFHPEDARYAKYANEEIETPLGKRVLLLADKDVEMEFGSGLVMLCTFGDKQDVIWMYRHKMPAIRAMDEVGRLVNAGAYDGMKAKEAAEKILDKIKTEGGHVKSAPLQQVVKVHDRCKHAIELLMSMQWFINVRDKKKEILDAALRMRWVPDFTIQYLVDWTTNLEWDWVISRQRVFGTPLPFYICEKCGHSEPAGYDELPFSVPNAKKKTCKCGAELKAETSTADCWVDSSITPLVISRWPDDEKFMKKVYPSSLRPQGVEIIRTWAFYTIYRCLMLTGQEPFRELLLNGNVLAPDGKKMSKSLGNIIAPDKLVVDYSADSVRQWAALSGAMAKDRPFSYQDIQYAKSFNNKLLNASKLVEKSLEGYAASDEDRKYLRGTDKWILSRMTRVIEEVTKDFENFDFHHATKMIHDFFWHEFCDYYLEYVKHRLYSPDKYGEESRRAAQYTLRYVLLNTIKLFAPVAPHLCEEIHSIFRKSDNETIHKSAWPRKEDALLDAKAEEMLTVLNGAVAQIRQHKAANKMPLNAELEHVTVTSPVSLKGAEEDIIAVGRMKKLTLHDGEFSVKIS